MRIWIAKLAIVIFVVFFVSIDIQASDKSVELEVETLISHLVLGRHSEGEDSAEAIRDKLISIGPPAVKHLIGVKIGVELMCSTMCRTFELDIEKIKKELLKELHKQLPEDMRRKDIYCKVEITDDEDGVNVIIHVPEQTSDPKDRGEYLRKAERLLDEIELFDPPERLEHE